MEAHTTKKRRAETGEMREGSLAWVADAKLAGTAQYTAEEPLVQLIDQTMLGLIQTRVCAHCWHNFQVHIAYLVQMDRALRGDSSRANPYHLRNCLRARVAVDGTDVMCQMGPVPTEFSS